MGNRELSHLSQAAIESNPIQLHEDLKHIHVPVVEEDLLEATCGSYTASYIAKMDSEYASFPPVVVDFVQHQRQPSCLGTCSTAV